MDMESIITRTAEKLLAQGGGDTPIGMILGSGLGGYADTLENKRYVPYAEIEGFPVSAVPGHENRFVLGEKLGRRVVVMQGRVHYYEGFPQPMLGIGVRAMQRIGVKTVLLTNAAGGVNMGYRPGALMLIADHINLSGQNALTGRNLDAFGTRFPDQSNVYDRDLRLRVRQTAAGKGIALEEGVYLMMSGPTFETPAEIRMCRTLGADAVGMSTVPEAVCATHAGMKVIGVSLITNMAAGILNQPLSHTEVNETAALAEKRFTGLIDAILSDVL